MNLSDPDHTLRGRAVAHGGDKQARVQRRKRFGQQAFSNAASHGDSDPYYSKNSGIDRAGWN